MTEDHRIGVGMLGAGFIGQMHSLSLLTAGYARRESPVRARLVALAERDKGLAAAVQRVYGWETLHDDWREVVANDDIVLFVNSGPNNAHREPTIEAARRGKHLFCEKPLASTADEALAMWRAAEAATVLHFCAYVHRFLPAFRLAKQMIQAGELGEIRHFRSHFLLDMKNPDDSLNWRFSKSIAGGGAVGDLGSHHIDAARYLVGEVRRVAAMAQTRSRDAFGRITDVNDDSFIAAAELENGATANFEASRVPEGHSLTDRIEIDGTKGSLYFELERLNELRITEPRQGTRTVMVVAPDHPDSDFFLPVGIQGAFPISWRDCFTFQAYRMLEAIQLGQPVAPGATFEDGYKVAEIVDTMQRSFESGCVEEVVFRTL